MTTEKQDKRYQTGQAKQLGDAPNGDEGVLTLLVSTDAMDEEGDVVEQSWTYPKQIPFLWAHKSRDLPLGHIRNPRVMPVEKINAEVSDDAVMATVVDVDFDDDDEFAQAVKRKYLRGDLHDSSVGFDPDDMEKFGDDEPGRFHFLSSTLKEVSATPIGANQDTQPLLKSFDPDVLPDTLRQQLEASESDGEGAVEKSGKPDVDKEGRRNSKMDERVQDHIKECAEYLKGDKMPDDMKGCPFHSKMGDEDDKSIESLEVKVVAEKLEEIVERKTAALREELEAMRAESAEPDDKSKSAEDGDPLVIDGEVLDVEGDESAEPDSSSGDDAVIDIASL